MIHGPFFSREEGEAYIKRNRHNLGDRPVCYCMSAWKTGGEYVRAHDWARLDEESRKDAERRLR